MKRESTSLEIIAVDVQDAIVKAEAELGVSSDEFRLDVLDEGDYEDGRQARIRVFLKDEDESTSEPDIDVVRQVVSDLIGRMEIEAEIATRYGDSENPNDEPPVMVDINGEDLSVLIGSNGKTLDALQYIVRLIVARKLERRANLVLDVDGYSIRREKQLQRLAQRVADQVTHQGRAIEMEPMSPRERRIIHVALSDHPQVTTESTGEGERRRVTIQPQL